MDHIADCFLWWIGHRVLGEVVSVEVVVCVCGALFIQDGFPPWTSDLLCVLLFHRWRERSDLLWCSDVVFLGWAFLKVYVVLVLDRHVFVVLWGTPNAWCWSIWWVCKGSGSFSVLYGSGGTFCYTSVCSEDVDCDTCGDLCSRGVACLHYLEKSL